MFLHGIMLAPRGGIKSMKSCLRNLHIKESLRSESLCQPKYCKDFYVVHTKYYLF